MKFIYTFLLSACLMSLNAQTDVYLNINHWLGNNLFSLNSNATNNIGSNYQVTRLDYYISEIELTYDGGQDTLLEGLYILVKADQPTLELLGQFNFTTLESIKFGIGVDPGMNHNDISQLPISHPLSFQLPSMHWGWAAGYRFVAMEGVTGPNMIQSWQLHALGDANYGYATVTTSGIMKNGDLYIALDADYEEAVRGINVNSNLNYHGEAGQAVTILQNFRTTVFSSSNTTFSVEENRTSPFTLFPNPSNGVVRALIEKEASGNSTIAVHDVRGVLVKQMDLNGLNDIQIEIDKPGLYIVTLQTDGQLVQVEKLLVK